MAESDPAGSPGTLRTLRTLPRPVVVLLVGIAVNRMGAFLAIFLILYLTSLGFSPAAAGVVLTLYGVGSIGGVFAGGLLSDRIGPRQVIIGSTLLSSVAVAAIAFETRYTWLMVTSLAAGVLTAAYRPAAAAMLAELTPLHRLVTTTAASRLGLNVGATLGPLIGAWLATHSYTAVFLVNAGTALTFGLVTIFLLPDVRAAAHAGDPALPATSDAAPEAGGRGMLHDRRYLAVLVAMFATALAEIQYQVILPLHLGEQGHPVSLYGTIIALNGAIIIALELPLTRTVQRLPIRTAIAVGSLCIGLGLAVFGFAGGIWVFVVGALIWTFGEIVNAPSLNAYPAMAAPVQLRGRYIGALSAVQSAGYAFGPLIGTTLFQFFGRAAWAVCAVLGVIAFGALWYGVQNRFTAVAPTVVKAPATT
ncbi:MFS transporter [Micromonospora yangpuensis]|uniref:Predicted arabinose efflux permease, MFS family n=1 Tax=Micromonospora yangpuensis TaxID=683228 RepID=A0A1C6UA30_9ACTN|nr:MFS transporter [Micromonospora yangpuensis]GGL87868.1 MFS transporter [Micromonospora yangpuensis]SCL50882.1 Predicted arabinose efflux permease, MFS family [Micromonospora yangpuensis]